MKYKVIQTYTRKEYYDHTVVRAIEADTLEVAQSLVDSLVAQDGLNELDVEERREKYQGGKGCDSKVEVVEDTTIDDEDFLEELRKEGDQS